MLWEDVVFWIATIAAIAVVGLLAGCIAGFLMAAAA